MGLNRSEISWQGKRWRLHREAASLNSVVEILTHDWPADDGELATLGPFMAYPVGHPSTLLTPPPLSDRGVLVTVVERTKVGAIKFELVSSESGDWLQRHPRTSEPASHIGGLLERFELERLTRLSDHWDLVRYAALDTTRGQVDADV